MKPAQYSGAAACAECHRSIYDAWKSSPHGRAMAEPTPATVLGDFSGRAVSLPDGDVAPIHDGSGYFMDIRTGGRQTRHRVDLVLASGRQHQVYLTRSQDGTLQLLPIFFSTRARRWIPTAAMRGSFDLDPASPDHWQRYEAVDDGMCFACHLSQGQVSADGQRVGIRWVDLSINCESCHGPGKAHIEHRRRGEPDDYPDLHLVDNVTEAKRCGSCHAFKQTYRYADEELAPITLASDAIRPDTTQLQTIYQYAGHVTSGCYSFGSATCAGCHDPHGKHARTLVGDSADGARTDAQCTVCHRDRMDAVTATHHSHHKGLTCVQCHMRFTRIADSDAPHQRTSDHSISIPHPAETAKLGLTDACTDCHTGRSPDWALAALRRWNQRSALGVRPWVQTIVDARARRTGATAELLRLLSADHTPPFVKLSALDLLADQPADATVPATLEKWTRDPAPYTRALALAALVQHDPAHAARWVDVASRDQHPLVRRLVLERAGAGMLSDAQLEHLVGDVTKHIAMLPTRTFAAFATELLEHGRLDRAGAMAELAIRWATPLQIARLELRRLLAAARGR